MANGRNRAGPLSEAREKAQTWSELLEELERQKMHPEFLEACQRFTHYRLKLERAFLAMLHGGSVVGDSEKAEQSEFGRLRAWAILQVADELMRLALAEKASERIAFHEKGLGEEILLLERLRPPRKTANGVHGLDETV